MNFDFKGIRCAPRKSQRRRGRRANKAYCSSESHAPEFAFWRSPLGHIDIKEDPPLILQTFRGSRLIERFKVAATLPPVAAGRSSNGGGKHVDPNNP